MRLTNVWCWLLIFFTLLIRNTYADELLTEDEQAPATLTLGLGADSEQGRDSYLDVYFPITAKLQLDATIAQSKTLSSDFLVPNTETNTYAGGILYHREDDLILGIDVGHWGQTDALTIDTLQATIGIERPTMSILFTPQKRELTLHTPITRLQKIDFTSNGLGVSISYFGFSDMTISVSHVSYSYSVNVKKVQILLDLVSLVGGRSVSWMSPSISAAGLNLAGGLEDHRSTFGFTYQFDDVEVGFDVILSESAIDASDMEMFTTYIAKQLSEEWSANIQFGNQRIKFANDVLFSSLSISHTF